MTDVHPAVLARYLAMRRAHRSIGVPGTLTAEHQIRALDPQGLLSMAERVGPERVRRMLEIRDPRPTEAP
jgi:hypothetical protein